MTQFWATLFDELYDQPPPASDADIAFLLESLHGPLSDEEVRADVALQRNPWPVNYPEHATWKPSAPSGWVFPPAVLPQSYLDFLRWSNGPLVRRGSREMGFFGTHELRERMVGYRVPAHMPGAIPIASTGGGEWILFDTREGLSDGEYPIAGVSEAGALDYGSARRIADTFEDLCRGTSSIGDAIHPATSLDPATIDVMIARAPAGGLRKLSAALRTLGVTTPASELLSYLEGLPKPLLKGVSYLPYSWKVADINRDDPFLEIVEHPGRRGSEGP